MIDQIQKQLLKGVPSPFFVPDDVRIKSIIDAVGSDTTIIDFGAGSGYFLYSLFKNGHKNYLGTECFHDTLSLVNNGLPIEIASKIVPWDVNDTSFQRLVFSLSQTRKKQALFLVRPCHHPLLIDTVINLGRTCNIQVYYISKSSNVEQDIRWHLEEKLEYIDMRGSSIDNEIMIKINP